ncbi:MAG TPA: transcriptional regulator [Bacteroidales bacterium]|nr:MAG: transcriptional regulator [Bacteroidetes bacterium GWE2_42_24]OFY25963.1 MAG: transcriptional regulator [Bacteroidetes bacterium GWF2_43_11]PKP27237.1 MAG: transcriptional regulator [Bacteroidetes bacterium HGW-Bacteroidetes-22]HBZ66628.1 transcriptional regulator [Bacteroidales bacterium]
MSKIELDIAKLESAASKMRSIAHPMRIAIIEMLSESTKMSVTEIYERLHIEQAAASHHLNILKSKGILASKREGKKIFYMLRNKAISQILDCLNRCNDD